MLSLLFDAAETEVPESGADPADAGVLGVVTELRDAADDDRVDAEQLADLGGRRGVGAIAVRKILLRHDFVEGRPLDDRVTAVLHQIVDQQIADALADIDVRPKDCRDAAINRRVVEIDDRDSGSASRRRWSAPAGVWASRMRTALTASHNATPTALLIVSIVSPAKM